MWKPSARRGEGPRWVSHRRKTNQEIEGIKIWVECSRANLWGDCEIVGGRMADVGKSEREVVFRLRPHDVSDHIWSQTDSSKLVRPLLNSCLSGHDSCLSPIDAESPAQ